jgi:hypothetical protein
LVFSRSIKLYIKGSFIVILWTGTGTLNGMLKFSFSLAYALNQQNVANTHTQTYTRRHFPKNCKLCKLSWIQDSRFWGKLLESRPGLGFKKFFPEYPKKIANSANFPGSINLEPNGIPNGILMILTW